MSPTRSSAPHKLEPAMCVAFGLILTLATVACTSTSASATCQPCFSHRPTDLPCGYMLQSATPALEPNQIIEPPKPTA